MRDAKWDAGCFAADSPAVNSPISIMYFYFSYLSKWAGLLTMNDS
jgi:hypothetical protein